MSVLAPCERCESPLEQGDLRCAICGEKAPYNEAPDADRVHLSVLRCQGCGAAVGYDPEHQAPACGFCDSVLEVEEITDPLEQTELYLPFLAATSAAEASLRRWWGNQGFFRVQDLRQRASVETLTPLWWVGWVFTADALISWTADSNAGSRRSAWAPHAGQRPMRFERLLVSASRGLTREETHTLVSSYDLGNAVPQPTGGPPNAVVECFDVQRSGARARIAEGIEGYAAGRVASQCIPGSTYRNLHVTALISGLVTNRYAFPAYVMAYRYKRKLYRVVISGQDADVLTGEAPLSLIRVFLAILGGILLIAAIVAAVAAAAS